MALVDPPIAINNEMALRKASYVSISRGFIPFSINLFSANPVKYAYCARLLLLAGGAALPNRAMPNASESEAIVLAVKRPAHVP